MEEKTLVCRNGDTFKVWRGYLENDPVRVSVDAEVMTLKKTMKRAENPFILNKMERIAVRVFSFSLLLSVLFVLEEKTGLSFCIC